MSANIPLFILGHPRSGTTALAQLLNTVPEVACLYQEGNLLYRLWQTLQRIDVLNEPVCDLLMDFSVTARHNLVNRAPKKDAQKLLFPQDAIEQLEQTYRHGLQTSHDPQKIYARVSTAFFALFARNAESRIVGDKVPDFIIIPEHITAPHPDSRVIFIARDPRAVVHSALRFNKQCLHLFAAPSSFAMAVSFCLKQRGLNRFFADFAGDRLLCLDQEELRTLPQAVAHKAAAFLSTPVPPGKTSGIPAPGTKNWQTEMAPEDKQAVTAVACAFGVLDAKRKTPGKWREKAEGMHELSCCPAQSIPQCVRQAATFFRESADEKNELGHTLVQLADYSHKRADFHRASSLFRQAVAVIPQDPVAWYKYGTLCYDMKQYDKALFCAEQSAKHCPNTAYYGFLQAKNHYLAGMTERLMGSTQKAELAFRAALKTKPDFSLPLKMLDILQSQKANPQ